MADDADFTRLAVSYEIVKTDLATLRSWTQDAITKLSREMDARLAETRAPFGPMAERMVMVESLTQRMDTDVLRLKRERNEAILRDNAVDRRLLQWTSRWALWVALVTVATDVVLAGLAYGLWRFLR